MFWRELYSVEEAGDYSEQVLGWAVSGQGTLVMPKLKDSLHVSVLNVGEMGKKDIVELLK